jgi:hypothetical protein
VERETIKNAVGFILVTLTAELFHAKAIDHELGTRNSELGTLISELRAF